MYLIGLGKAMPALFCWAMLIHDMYHVPQALSLCLDTPFLMQYVNNCGT